MSTHEVDAVTELMSDRNHLMLGHVKGVCRVVVALDKLDKTQRFNQLIHAALGPVELNPRAGDLRGHDFTAGAAHQPVERTAAPVVEWNVLAWAEILQVGEDCEPTAKGAALTAWTMAPCCFGLRTPRRCA